MSEILDNREHARSLRRRLNDHSIDIEVLALEAMHVFDSARLATQMHWLNLELLGYTSSAQSSSVHEILGLSAQDRLVIQVKTYRVQPGRLAGGPQAGVAFHHFFVEPIRQLVEAQARVRGVPRSLDTVRLDFAVDEAKRDLPTSGEFSVDTFDRIVLGFRAVLHLQLGPIAQ
ncbi:MAG: hypothetical protein JWO86_1328 [Myxococcaceae bacterium]|jgi:hypothetical protein|nr:hypothetical protein [Myxococcaceae bacterium]MEA2747231.1 hypothetical protein [Myxococcales bacterium]